VMADELLRVEQLRSWYGHAQVLWDIAFTLEAGDGLGIIGHNGAGKSTLLRSVAGVHRKVSGQVVLEGNEVLDETPFEIARRGMSFVREGAPVFGELSVVENLTLGGELARRRDQEPLPFEQVYEIFPVLGTMGERKAGLLSGGQRQMLALSAALISRPSILVLDEPSGGLAPEAAATVFAAIGRLRENGLSILIAEQNLDWLTGVASHTLEIESGRMQVAA
jgi:branched-chain amino acid transport system ATP-binding protein